MYSETPPYIQGVTGKNSNIFARSEQGDLRCFYLKVSKRPFSPQYSSFSWRKHQNQRGKKA